MLETQPGAPQIGGYIPNAQLLAFCKSSDKLEWGLCWSFVAGVIESSGLPSVKWPKGPIELGRELGLDHVLATMDALFDRYHEERYRAAPLLRNPR